MEKKIKEQLIRIKHVALDMDGTIYMGNSIFPFTIPFLEKLDGMGISYSFLTNNNSCYLGLIPRLTRTRNGHLS